LALIELLKSLTKPVCCRPAGGAPESALIAGFTGQPKKVAKIVPAFRPVVMEKCKERAISSRRSAGRRSAAPFPTWLVYG
jgi:hypothetical protein